MLRGLPRRVQAEQKKFEELKKSQRKPSEGIVIGISCYRKQSKVIEHDVQNFEKVIAYIYIYKMHFHLFSCKLQFYI